jgi:hypothetical protein
MPENTRIRMLLKTIAQESVTLRLLAIDPDGISRRFGLTPADLQSLRSADLLRASQMLASRSRGLRDPRQEHGLAPEMQRGGPPPPPPGPPKAVTVVNMVPKALSNEQNQDSEPWLSVNPANPRQLVATAFTPNPSGTGNAPVYASTDGGNSWVLNAIIPSAAITADVTHSFAGATSNFYAGIIVVPVADNTPRVRILRTADPFAAGTMSILFDQQGQGLDQPRMQSTTIAGRDRVYGGVNDFNASPQTAALELTLDGASPSASLSTVRIEDRSTGNAGQDGPTVMPLLTADGKVYAGFFHWRSVASPSDNVTADVVVVRDDNGGGGANPFRALIGADGNRGIRVVQGIIINLSMGLGPQPERVGSDLTLAADPSNSSHVYLGYGDIQAAGYTLHLRQSTDGGKTWSGDLRTVLNATNPSLAVNSAGKLAFLYQQLTGTGNAQRWATHVIRTVDLTNWVDLVLATVPANTPISVGDPYLGDYVKLQAIDRDFYGVFCANNAPDLANFPQGVQYQRNADFRTHTLLGVDGTTPVLISIDPFFFRIKE